VSFVVKKVFAVKSFLQSVAKGFYVQFRLERLHKCGFCQDDILEKMSK